MSSADVRAGIGRRATKKHTYTKQKSEVGVSQDSRRVRWHETIYERRQGVEKAKGTSRETSSGEGIESRQIDKRYKANESTVIG